MKLAGHFIICTGVGILSLATAIVSVPAQESGNVALAGNPYAAIAVRNVFNLVPEPTNPPADTKPPDPPAKITPNGIMDLFGTLQVLFKVATPPKPGQPPADKSYVMSEGDREDGISVVKIDKAAETVTFDNNGVVQTLPLVAAADGGGGGGSGGGPEGRGPGDRMRARFPGRGMGGSDHGYVNGPGGGSFSAAGSSSGDNSGGSNPGDGSSLPIAASAGQNPDTTLAGAQAKLNAMLNDPNYLTPEAQVIAMEANRQALKAAGDPTAALIPPTEITSQMQGDSGGGDTPANP